jgi:hypothetical protein
MERRSGASPSSIAAGSRGGAKTIELITGGLEPNSEEDEEGSAGRA